MLASSMRPDADDWRLPADGPAPGFSIDIVGDRDGFMRLKPEWEVLFARAGLPHQLFQGHGFLRHWCDHYLEAGDRLCIVTGRSDGRLVMLWPLLRKRCFGFELARFMGAPVAQFGDVLLEPDAQSERWLERGWNALSRLGIDLVELRRLRSDAALHRAGRLEYAVPIQHQQAPFADLALRVAPDGPSTAYPARDRSNYRRRLRRLAARGKIGFATLPPGPQGRELAGLAVTLKRQMLAQHGVAAPTIADPRFRAFFSALAGDESDEAGLRLSVVTCDGCPVGVDLSFDCKGRSFGHVIAGDPAFEREGLGRVLVHHAFAGAHARGSTMFDLLAPADPHKLEHADGAVAVWDLAVPLSWRGQFACDLGLPHLRPALKLVAKRLPAAWVRRLAGESRIRSG
jgi:CelD/BcsL family acetyltransferase involved in cellulose biosynthesis